MRLKSVYILGLYIFFAATAASADVNIAIIAPMDGDYAVDGSELLSGARTAVDELNNGGGLNGEKINLIEVEDKCNDSLAVSTAQMMALNTNDEYRASAVIGPYCPNRFQKVADTLAAAGIFQIIPTAVNSVYADDKHGGLVKMVGYKEQQAEDFFKFYNTHFNWMRVALIFDDNNTEIAQAVQNMFVENKKSDNLEMYNFEVNDSNGAAIADAAIQAQTKIAFILTDAEKAANIALELKSRKHKYIIFANKYQVMPRFGKILGRKADGCYFMGLPSLKDSPEFTETLVKLRLLGIEPEGLAVYGYSAVNLWADLVRKSGSFAYTALAHTLRDNSFESGWGKIMFANGNPVNTLNYGIYRLKHGEYTQVY